MAGMLLRAAVVDFSGWSVSLAGCQKEGQRGRGPQHRRVPAARSPDHSVPVYEELPGWSEDISGVRRFADLPQAAQDYVLRSEELAHCRVSAIGVGPGREATISRHSLIG